MEKKTNKSADKALQETEAQTTFKGEVNAYGFIHLNRGVREAWGIQRGEKTPITIEINAEDALIIRKA